MSTDYWRRIWGWYDAGGLNHVAAYLAELDLAKFDPKAPPPKTPAFWQIVSTGSAPEDAELADLLDKLGNPDAVTLAQLRAKADASFDEWLSDRRNRRAIPHRMNSCGYVPVRNPDTDDGLWRIKGVRQAIYAKAALSHDERFQAAQASHSRSPAVIGSDQYFSPFSTPSFRLFLNQKRHARGRFRRRNDHCRSLPSPPAAPAVVTGQMPKPRAAASCTHEPPGGPQMLHETLQHDRRRPSVCTRSKNRRGV